MPAGQLFLTTSRWGSVQVTHRLQVTQKVSMGPPGAAQWRQGHQPALQLSIGTLRAAAAHSQLEATRGKTTTTADPALAPNLHRQATAP